MYGPEFLRVLGDPHPTGTMTVAQVLEIASMLVVGSVMARFRLRGLLLWAIGLSVLRFGMSAVAGVHDQIGWHVAGIALHGVCYTFYFITAQVYLDRRVQPSLRNQAQGLLVMVSAGLGPLAGALLCGWLRHRCVTPDGHGWTGFWLVLAAIIAVCWLILALGYRERPEDRPAADL
jgi:MFS family permease